MVTWIHAATIFRRYFQVVTVKTEKVIASLEGHEDSVEVVSFSPTYVLGWSTFQPGNNNSGHAPFDGHVSAMLLHYAMHQQSNTRYSFASRHPYLVTGSLDGKLCIWETSAGFKLRHTLPHEVWV